MFLRPALDPASETEGARLRVRDPVTMSFLADDGEEKPESEYWLRRWVEGGVERQVDGKWPEKAGDVKAGSVSNEQVGISAEGAAAAATVATVAFMLTAADRIALSQLGYSGEAIAQMTPEEGKKLVADQTPASLPVTPPGPEGVA